MVGFMRGFAIVLAVLLGLGQPVVQAQDCSSRPYCTKMSSCAEADYYFRQCGHRERDGDNDGIPCEDLCGKTMKQYQQRRQEGGRF